MNLWSVSQDVAIRHQDLEQRLQLPIVLTPDCEHPSYSLAKPHGYVTADPDRFISGDDRTPRCSVEGRLIHTCFYQNLPQDMYWVIPGVVQTV